MSVKKIEISAFDLAMRFVGMKETPGVASNPQIVAMLRLDAAWPGDEEVAWCSAFANWIAWMLRLPRSHSLAARSWLTVGTPIKTLADAQMGFDVVILKRGKGTQPGPQVINAPGHVAFFAGYAGGATVMLLGGNQSDGVTVAPFSVDDVLGVRRLY